MLSEKLLIHERNLTLGSLKFLLETEQLVLLDVVVGEVVELCVIIIVIIDKLRDELVDGTLILVEDVGQIGLFVLHDVQVAQFCWCENAGERCLAVLFFR